MITRIPVVDDTGDGTSGTPINAAWWTQVQDMIDARWSVQVLGASSPTTARDVDISEADLVVCTNSAPLTISGFLAPRNPGKAGKAIRVINAGSSVVNFTHSDAGSALGNRLQNIAFSAPTPINTPFGSATYAYWPQGQCWILAQHEQGAWLTQALTAGMFTGGTPNLSGGTSVRYRLSGRTLRVHSLLESCTVPTAAPILMQLPGGFTPVYPQHGALTAGQGYDNGAPTPILFTVTTGGINIVLAWGGGPFGVSAAGTHALGTIELDVN